MLNSFTIPLEQLDAQLDEISKFIDQIRLSKISRSTVSYNAVIISLYSCYENFVNALVSELIYQISDKSTHHSEFPTDMQKRNIQLSSDFLNSGQRYKRFDLKANDVINNIYSGKLNNKLLLKHGGNLSTEVLSEYLKSLGIKDVIQSIKNDSEYCSYYSKLKAISIEEAKRYLQGTAPETVFNILSELISQRNTIAHSWKSDNKIDYLIIEKEWIQFIRTFCKCLYNKIVHFYCEWLVNNNKLFSPKSFIVYGSSVIGFYNVIPNHQRPNEIMLIKINNKIHIVKIVDIKIFENHEVSMKIDGYQLKKDKTENYSFYFDKLFLSEYTDSNGNSDDISINQDVKSEYSC